MAEASAILEDVRRLVAEILAMELDEVRPEMLFFSDLDGESIDLIELSFRLEKLYGVRVRFQDLKSDDYTLDEQGCLTLDSLARLKARYPFLKLEGFESRSLNRRGDFLTVEAIAGFVQMALSANRPAAGSSIAP